MRDDCTRLALRALKYTSLELPYLAGLVGLVHISPDRRIETAGVFASGRIVINPEWFLQLSMGDAMFVVAHELLHLLLQTHRRSEGSDPLRFNVAHDIVINNKLISELGLEQVPAGGIYQPWGFEKSAEQIYLQHIAPPAHHWMPWKKGSVAPESSMQEALRQAGLTKDLDTENPLGRYDALSESLEREWYQESRLVQKKNIIAIQDAAQKAIAQELVYKQLWAATGLNTGFVETAFKSQESLYQAPWEMVLQRWIEQQAPGNRSFSRPSRKASGLDVILPGRLREGWTLYLVLDTSGSMWGELSYVLGVIRQFAEAAEVQRVVIVQCDAAIQTIEEIIPEDLEHYQIKGAGGTSLDPAFDWLSAQPDIRGAVVITDGYLELPPDPLFSVLWAIVGWGNFEAPYGVVTKIERRPSELNVCIPDSNTAPSDSELPAPGLESHGQISL
jgi:predicted metal-dependent peptidase